MLSVTPYYNKPTPEGLFQHYRAIAEAVPLPIIVYNVPGRTGVNVDVADAGAPGAVPNIVGVKEASGNMAQMCEICRAVPDDFVVLSGDDALTLPVMAVGGRGIISVASNEVPAEMARMVELAEARRLRRRAPAAPRSCCRSCSQLRRVEPDPGEGRDGDDGPARGDATACRWCRRGLPHARGSQVLRDLGCGRSATVRA